MNAEDQSEITHWPLWKKVLAYASFAALSLVTIYVVDVRVHLKSQMPHAANAKTGTIK